MKRKVRKLWELCFDDPKEYVDLYFKKRYTEEGSMTLIKDNKLVAALQLIPYQMTFNEETLETAYVSGACTHPDYRNQGVMGRLLQESLRKLWDREVPLSMLIPAEPKLYDYYRVYEYSDVFHRAKRVVTLPAGSTRVVFYTINIERTFNSDIYIFLRNHLMQHSCCIQHTAEDYEMILADLRMNSGFVVTAREQEIIKGIAFVRKEKGVVQIDELLTDSEDVEKELLIFISRSTHSSQLRRFLPAKAMEEHRAGMIRIVNVEQVLRAYARNFPHKKLAVNVTDTILKRNNALYYMYSGKCVKHVNNNKEINAQKVTVAELAHLLFDPLHPYMSLMLD